MPEPEDKYVVKLKRAILDGEGKTVTELRFPDPEEATIGQLGVMDEADGDISKTIHAIAGLTGIPVGSAKKISLKDMKAINLVLADFID